MSKKLCISQPRIGFLSIFVTFALQMGAGAEVLVEAAREIPLAYDVDVVVAGGQGSPNGYSIDGTERRSYLIRPLPTPGRTSQAWLALFS